MSKIHTSLISITLLAAALGTGAAQAREYYRHLPEARWRTGHWVHDRHGGRLGWWWVVGPSWVWYDRPHSFVVVPPPAPTVVYQPGVPMAPAPVVIAQAAPPPQVVMQPQQPPMAAQPVAPPASPVLYYCKATGTHYPETMSCPGGWSTMTAETPPQPMAPGAPAGAPASDGGVTSQDVPPPPAGAQPQSAQPPQSVPPAPGT